MVKKHAIRLVFATVAILYAGHLAAVEVYQWTDENGVVHYSQWAPGDHVEDVETVSVKGGSGADNGLGISEEDDPEGYRAHRAEMDAMWAELEARREAGREREAQAPTTEIVYFPYEDYNDYPVFWPGFGPRPPFRPDRPPLRPTPQPKPLPSVPFRRP